MPVMRIFLTVLLMLVGASLPAFGLLAADSDLIVQVASGRQFRGTLGMASTDQQLALLDSAQGVTRQRWIDWDRIITAQLGGQPVKIALLQSLAQKARDNSAPSPRRPTGHVIEMRGVAASSEPLPAPATPPTLPRQVTTVAFDSRLANWDADVETDGLVLDIAAVDGDGYLIPASGTLQVELFAPERRTFHHAPRSGGDTLELVERWTRAISADDFGPSGLRLRLPYGAVHPEIDYERQASWYGLVHVRLALPGHGVFEDSQDGVRIRPWAPNRDQLEMNTLRRFLPTERLGRRD